MLNNILSCKINTIWITCANITLIIYLAYMSLNVNITKNYFPKSTKSIVTYFNFIKIAQLPLSIEHHKNLVKYQLPNPIIPNQLHSNASILKYFSNIQHLLLDVVEWKKTPKATLHMLKLRTGYPMEWNTFFWQGTWQLDHSHNEHNLYTNLFRFTKSFKTQNRFIPIIIILNTFMRPWTNIPARDCISTCTMLVWHQCPWQNQQICH